MCVIIMESKKKYAMLQTQQQVVESVIPARQNLQSSNIRSLAIASQEPDILAISNTHTTHTSTINTETRNTATIIPIWGNSTNLKCVLFQSFTR